MQQASGIHGTKHRKTISCKAWNYPIEYPSRASKRDIKESEGNVFNRIFKENVQWRKHPGGAHLQNQNYLVTEKSCSSKWIEST